jgi:hypothetical protein
MPLADDGDIVRGLGFVTLYSAYLEETVDECVSVFLAADPSPDDRMNRQPISEKIRYCQRRLQAHEPLPDELRYLPGALDRTRVVLERRHDVVHGRIYAIPGAGDVRRSGRQGVPERQVTSAELYGLANDIFAAQDPLMHASTFRLPRFLLKLKSSDAPA